MAMALVGGVLVLALKKKDGQGSAQRTMAVALVVGAIFLLEADSWGEGKNELQANFGLVDHSSEHMVEADSSAGRFKIFQVRE